MSILFLRLKQITMQQMTKLIKKWAYKRQETKSISLLYDV